MTRGLQRGAHASHGADWRCALVYQEGFVLAICHAESNFAHFEIVQMGVRPLEDIVERGERHARWNMESTPNAGLDVR